MDSLDLSPGALDHLRAVMLAGIGADPGCVSCAEIIRALPNRDDPCECKHGNWTRAFDDEGPWRCDLCGGVEPDATTEQGGPQSES